MGEGRRGQAGDAHHPRRVIRAQNLHLPDSEIPMRRTAPAILVLAILSGCIAMPERNEALGVDPRAAAEEHERLRRETAPLPRPVVVINGYHALPSAAARLARQLAEATCDDPSNFLAVSHTFESDIDRITARVIERVEARWPSDDPEATV